MHKVPRSVSIDSSGQEVSSRYEGAYLLPERTPFDEAVSGSPSGGGLETVSWLPFDRSRRSRRFL